MLGILVVMKYCLNVCRMVQTCKNKRYVLWPLSVKVKSSLKQSNASLIATRLMAWQANDHLSPLRPLHHYQLPYEIAIASFAVTLHVGYLILEMRKNWIFVNAEQILEAIENLNEWFSGIKCAFGLLSDENYGNASSKMMVISEETLSSFTDRFNSKSFWNNIPCR